MADNITWLLNADASQVRAEMNAAVAAVNTGTSGMIGGFSRGELAHGTFLKSNAKVAHQVENLAHSMLYGADSTTVMVTALEGLGRSVKIPLAPLAGLFIGATVIKSVYDYRQEWVKLNEEMAKARKLPATTSKEVETKLGAEKAGVAAAEDKKKNETWWQAMKRHAGDMIKSTFGIELLNPVAGAVIHALRGSPSIKKDTDKQVEETKQQELKDEKKLAELKHEEVVAEEAKRFKDSLQFSLADIAKEGNKRKTGTFDSGRTYQGDLAQQALDEQMAARKAMMAGHPAEAIQHQSMAEQIKASIPALKDSEKIATFKTALDTSDRLREIASKVSFENK
ncbi:MAG: hypothetical protein QOI07_919 [Verrucomicrobiota bacterium]|jgi:hypothetical protein